MMRLLDDTELAHKLAEMLKTPCQVSMILIFGTRCKHPDSAGLPSNHRGRNMDFPLRILSALLKPLIDVSPSAEIGAHIHELPELPRQHVGLVISSASFVPSTRTIIAAGRRLVRTMYT